MVKMRVMPKAEAQQTRQVKAPGVRRQRMNKFDEYVQALLDNPGEAVVLEELGEPGNKFMLTLRGALHRHGLDQAVVRKMRGRDEVRLWISEEGEKRPRRRRTASGSGDIPQEALPGFEWNDNEEAELEHEPAEVSEVNEPRGQVRP